MVEVQTQIDVYCVHCGEPCETEVRGEKGLPFCCNGCKAVYTILNSEDGNCPLPDLEAIKSIKRLRQTKGFLWLDNVELAKEFVKFRSDNEVIVGFHLPAMHCSACLYLLEALPKMLVGVNASRVNFLEKQIEISFNPTQIKLSEVAGWLSSVGYEPSLIESNKTETSPKGTIGRIAVAGFIFGNSMLFSLADYFGINLTDALVRTTFISLNVLLAIPLVVFCAAPYYVSAIAGIKNKKGGLDLPIALGISALFLRSVIEVLFYGGTGYFDSLSGLVFFLLIGKYIQQRTFSHLQFDRNVKSYLPMAVELLDSLGNFSEYVRAKDLQVGQQYALAHGQVIPTDSSLISPFASIDYSFVTGESQPNEMQMGDSIFAGGKITTGRTVLQVLKPMDQSYFLGIWNKANPKKQKQFALEILNQLFARYFTIFTLSIASLTLLYWAFVNPANIWNATTAVLIVACPCALTLSLPFALGNALSILGKKGIYLRNQSVLHQLGQIKAIAFDKTGTLTALSSTKVLYAGKSLQAIEKEALITLCMASTHPVAEAIRHNLGDSSILVLTHFEEVLGCGIQGKVGGYAIRLGKAEWILNKPNNQGLEGTVLQINGSVFGSFSLHSEIPGEVVTSLRKLKEQFPLYLLTGDKETGLQSIKPLLPCFSEIKSGLMPDEKEAFVATLENRGLKTIMVGDGINDTSALATASVGIAVTSTKNSFTPACDIMMDAVALPLLPNLISFAKACRTNIINSFWLSVVYNLVGLSVAVSGQLSPVFAAVFMPLSSISVVAFSTWATAISARKRNLSINKSTTSWK